MTWLTTVTCSVPDCDRSVHTRGWCKLHYERWRRHGDLTSRRRPSGLDRAQSFAWFMPGSPPTEGCWDWTGPHNGRYGRIVVNGVQIGAHELSYQLFNGTVSEDDCVLHSCDRPICVQPRHLHLGTHEDNAAEREMRGRAAIGERNGLARLTEDQVRWIRKQTGMTQQSMADLLGVSREAVSSIRTGKTWKHLSNEAEL